MIPKRRSHWVFANFTLSASWYVRFFGIKQIIENGYMLLISLVEPARLWFNMYNWLPFNFNTTQGVIGYH
jgi:hypothetical protein